MQLLKQSTSVDVRMGPFMDASDAVTPETGVLLTAADQAEALKHDGAATVDISSNTWAAVTGADGWYDLTLSTSDTGTLGLLDIVVQDASVCLPVFARFMVVPANVYDSLIGGSDQLQVDTVQIASTTADATALGQGASCLKTGTVGSGSTTTTIVSGLTTSADQFNGRIVTFTTDTTTTALQGQSTDITDTDGSGNLTVTALTTAPVSGDTYVIS